MEKHWHAAHHCLKKGYDVSLTGAAAARLERGHAVRQADNDPDSDSKDVHQEKASDMGVLG